jgi:hypothetical protein
MKMINKTSKDYDKLDKDYEVVMDFLSILSKVYYALAQQYCYEAFGCYFKIENLNVNEDGK